MAARFIRLPKVMCSLCCCRLTLSDSTDNTLHFEAYCLHLCRVQLSPCTWPDVTGTSWSLEAHAPTSFPLLAGFEQVSFESTVQDWMQDGFDGGWRTSTSTDGGCIAQELHARQVPVNERCNNTARKLHAKIRLHIQHTNLSCAGHPGMPAAPVRIPSYEPGLHDAPTGGTPMGTPPSAKGIAAELPFAAGNQEGSVVLTSLQHSIS